MSEAILVPSSTKKRWAIYWLCVLALVITTALQVVFYYRDEISVLFYALSCVSIGGGVYAWCHFDSKERGKKLSQNMRMAIGFIGPIAVPIYFIESRGFKAAIKTGLGLLLYAPFYIIYYGVWYLTVAILHALGYYS